MSVGEKGGRLTAATIDVGQGPFCASVVLGETPQITLIADRRSASTSGEPGLTIKSQPMPKQKPPGFRSDDFIRLRELPYLSAWPSDERAVPVMTYRQNDGHLRTYIPWDGNEFIAMRPKELGPGIYVGQIPHSNGDLLLPLWTLILRHFSTKFILAREREVLADLENAMSSIHKYFVILDFSSRGAGFADVPMIRSEIEYAFTNHRSMFDQLNKLIGACLRIACPSAQQIPESFADVVKRSEENLALKLKLPPQIVAFYRSRAVSFQLLRDVRDDIVHRGHANEQWIFSFPDGFAVDVERGFLARLTPLNIFPSETRREGSENLASLLAFFAFVLEDMLNAAAEAARAIETSAQSLPPNIANGNNVYLRSPVASHALNVARYRATPWLVPEKGLAPTSE